MLGIGKVEQWDLLKCYKENRAYEGISSFIGMTTGNKPMYLDIHEKKLPWKRQLIHFRIRSWYYLHF